MSFRRPIGITNRENSGEFGQVQWRRLPVEVQGEEDHVRWGLHQPEPVAVAQLHAPCGGAQCQDFLHPEELPLLPPLRGGLPSNFFSIILFRRRPMGRNRVGEFLLLVGGATAVSEAPRAEATPMSSVGFQCSITPPLLRLPR